jgi:hypothetical protein
VTAPVTAPAPDAVRCPRCGAALAADQDWCLSCGTAARTVIAPTPNWRLPIALAGLVAALAAAALVFAFVTLAGNDDAVRAATKTASTPAGPNLTGQLASLQRCMGGTATQPIPTFDPTVDVARAQGGGGFATTVDGVSVELIVFPTADAAQVGFRNAADHLISLQQTQPQVYASLAATATQVLGNVLEIAPAGAPPPTLTNLVTGCVAKSGP